jgi:hypothetical protein
MGSNRHIRPFFYCLAALGVSIVCWIVCAALQPATHLPAFNSTWGHAAWGYSLIHGTGWATPHTVWYYGEGVFAVLTIALLIATVVIALRARGKTPGAGRPARVDRMLTQRSSSPAPVSMASIEAKFAEGREK